MDYRDFTPRATAFNEFVKLRRVILDSAEDNTFSDSFTELCARAMANDPVAQDVVAYFFNKGIPDRLYPNFEYYMSWEILAGANGNEFALEKLEFFLNPSLNQIFDDDEILEMALKRKNITKDNALLVVSNLLCEGIVDEMKLDPKQLVKFKQVLSNYAPEKNRPFSNALNKCTPDVVEFLVS